MAASSSRIAPISSAVKPIMCIACYSGNCVCCVSVWEIENEFTRYPSWHCRAFLLTMVRSNSFLSSLVMMKVLPVLLRYLYAKALELRWSISTRRGTKTLSLPHLVVHCNHTQSSFVLSFPTHTHAHSLITSGGAPASSWKKMWKFLSPWLCCTTLDYRTQNEFERTGSWLAESNIWLTFSRRSFGCCLEIMDVKNYCKSLIGLLIMEIVTHSLIWLRPLDLLWSQTPCPYTYPTISNAQNYPCTD